MGRERECTVALRKLVGTPSDNTFVATVTSVDGAVCTVSRITDLKEFSNVRLNVSSTEKQGIVITPKIDSDVSVTTTNGYDWFVSQYSEIEKITVDAEDTIIINGGTNEGLIKIKELTERLKNLESAFNSHTHSLPPMTAGTFPVTALSPVPPGYVGLATGDIGLNKSTEFQSGYSSYENKKIKH
jgi:hypothetical protein